MMLSYVTVGTNDLDRARRFYDAMLGELGLACTGSNDHEIGYSDGPDRPRLFWVLKPFDGKPAHFGNGVLVAFNAPSRASVEAFHRTALALGGTDEGAPGLRHYRPNFFAAYVRDPDGNKLSAVCEKPE